jgi:hypothetical protein
VLEREYHSTILTHASASTKMQLSFPVLRYHPPMHLGGGKTASFQIYEAPMPVRDSWAAVKLSLSGKRLDYLRSEEAGTDGSGLFKSPQYLTYSDVLPGGLLDTSGRHIPILNYWRSDDFGHEAIRFFASFAAIFGVRYQHKFQFGAVEVLDFAAYKTKIISLLRQQNAQQIPKKELDQATSYREAIAIFTNLGRLNRFACDYEVGCANLMP